jgi:hypothetical protein
MVISDSQANPGKFWTTQFGEGRGFAISLLIARGKKKQYQGSQMLESTS